jgi:hypothetical protein
VNFSSVFWDRPEFRGVGSAQDHGRPHYSRVVLPHVFAHKIDVSLNVFLFGIGRTRRVRYRAVFCAGVCARLGGLITAAKMNNLVSNVRLESFIGFILSDCYRLEHFFSQLLFRGHRYKNAA